MGDFNDDPFNRSITDYLQASKDLDKVEESPRMPAPQLPADEPTIMEPIASMGSRNKNIVASAQPEVGQDVKDRRIAHIVTGGLSN